MNLSLLRNRRILLRLALGTLGAFWIPTGLQAMPLANASLVSEWEVLQTAGDQSIYGSHFTDARHGRVVGWGGASGQAAIHSTQDGGESWQAELVMPGTLLFDVDTLNEWVVAVGQQSMVGVIFSSIDGGANYATTPIPASFGLYAVEALGPGSAVVCGYDGAMLKTVDGGANWLTMATPFPNSVYRSMSFANERVGYALGGSAFQGKRVIRTVDGGVTWISVKNFFSPHVYSDLAAITSGPSAGRRVVLAGSDGVSAALQTSDDGGLMWNNTLNDPAVTILQSVGSLGQVLWAGGVGNSVYRSGDSGQNWTIHPTPGPFIGCVSVTPEVVYMGGNNGRVFRRRN